MEWLKELLKKLGIAETEVDKIDAEVVKELPKHFVTKTQYNDVVEARKKAEKDVTDRDAQITELGKTAGLSEELKQQIATLQNENTSAKEKYEADLKELQMGNAIKAKLMGKVHDEGLAAGLIDKTKLVVDGDKVVGLDEQITAIKGTHAFLFKEEQQQQAGFKVGGAGNATPPAGEVSLKDAIAAHFQAK